MNRLLAFVWLVIIGTNVAEYYSQTVPYQGAIILMGATYFLFAYGSNFLRLAAFPDFNLLLAVLVVPVLLMWSSDRTFERAAYTSQVAIALVFLIASVVASRVELGRAVSISAFVIVAVGTALNLYELFVQNNVWSVAPGRSAGLYVNPNVSGQALVGYGLVFLTSRMDEKVRAPDVLLICLVVIGVFATFSRAGILGALLLLFFAIVLRSRRKHVLRLVLGGMAISLVMAMFGYLVVRNLQLSNDAEVRVLSLIQEGGVGDYPEDRGATALASLDLAMEHPLEGVGVRTIYQMGEGPHNMFIAMMVDYGVLGLIVYLVIIARMTLIARRTARRSSALIMVVVSWLVIFSFASHNLLDDSSTIPLLGFAIARAWQIRHARLPACFERRARDLRVPCES